MTEPRGSGKSLTSTLFYETAEKIAAITSMSAMEVLDKAYRLSQVTPYSMYGILNSMYAKALRGEDLDSIIMGLK
jgi:predicted RNA polymerase sigma factor